MLFLISIVIKTLFFVAVLSQMKSFEYTEIPLSERTMSLCLCDLSAQNKSYVAIFTCGV